MGLVLHFVRADLCEAQPGELDLSSGRITVPKAPNLDAYIQKIYHMKDEYFAKLGHKW